ncbi:hypothetical protein HK405_000437 [Cladochytrium tenue]|nr:hypothetical protein HK405_000437 [Cladochytrium tenue]
MTSTPPRRAAPPRASTLLLGGDDGADADSGNGGRLNASILFPELAKEMAANPSLTLGLRGLFIVTVFKRGERREEW